MTELATLRSIEERYAMPTYPRAAVEKGIQGMVAEVLAIAGRVDEASKTADEALASDPKDAHAAYAKAVVSADFDSAGRCQDRSRRGSFTAR